MRPDEPIKAARPDAGRAVERPVADELGQRAAAGDAPNRPGQQEAESRTDRTTVVTPAEGGTIRPPHSSKSYTATPSKPEDGRPVARALGSTPYAGAPPSADGPRRDGSDTKPVGADPDASPGIAPRD